MCLFMDYIAKTREELLNALSLYTDSANMEKLARIKQTILLKWLLDVAKLTKPSKIFVVTSNPEDIAYIRRRAIENGEEIQSKYNPLHVVHFNGPRDLARDRENTRILVKRGVEVAMVNTKERNKGLNEVQELLGGAMRNKEMYIGFYCFGPRNSPYTLYGVQVTDSAYVIHSSNILYRVCYDVFTDKDDIPYMRFLHSAGERDHNGWSVNVHRRRIYIDVEDQVTYSVNTQYAGNTVGLKKLSLRLCVLGV
jgi:phosphoenolpyruvate carboxykinase (GTP)